MQIEPTFLHETTFSNFRAANVARSAAAFFPVESKDPIWWTNALAGEAGEACNVTKKIDRGDTGPEASIDALAEELADVVIYADLCAARHGINLGQALCDKFNKVSEKRGAPQRLALL